MGGTLDRYLHYGHDPAGNILTRSEGTLSSHGYDLTTTYGYDGNDQLTSETATGFLPSSYGYTYDNNGNRITQTVNGSQTQHFVYDAHDKMTSGTGETDSYDVNGNEHLVTRQGVTATFTYDDEDRFTAFTYPGGPTDTFTYNGLGLRVGKTDSSGTYRYVCDGTSPGSPILSDGQALYTPGLSEHRGSSSLFYNSDDLGNLWTADDGTGQAEAGAYLFTGFGAPLYTGSGAAGASPLKYGGANDCQTDGDTGLVLMGCRYYDTRIGRFISQDPIGDGDNWYTYADNSPTNEVDPGGLMPMDGPGSSPVGSPGYADGAVSGFGGSMEEFGVIWHPYFVGGAPYYNYDTPGVSHDFYYTYWAPDSFDLGGPLLGTVDLGRLPTLLTGPYANRSIPARSTARDWTSEEINQVNEIGNESGCHTCGAETSGNKLGTWVKDHQPPSKINPPGNSQRLFPQCKKCSASQGGTLSQIKEELDEFVQAVKNLGSSSSSTSAGFSEGSESGLEVGEDPFEIPIIEIP